MRSALMTLVILALALSACRASEATASNASHIILFVSEPGSGLSAIAGAHFGELARAAGLDYEPQWRVTGDIQPTRQVTLYTEFSSGGFASAIVPSMSKEDVNEADHIVVVDAWFPYHDRFAAKVTYWTGIPSPLADLAVARDDIRQRVRRLVDLLAPPAD